MFGERSKRHDDVVIWLHEVGLVIQITPRVRSAPLVNLTFGLVELRRC
jgi:hypothetical protein